MSPLARIAAALVAGKAWLGLAVQVVASVARTGSLAAALWTMLLYFTVIANLIVALAFTAAALDGRARPRLLAFVTTAILLVGLVYAALLRGLLELSGGAHLADTLLHIVVPLLVPLFWLVFVPRGHLRRHDPCSGCSCRSPIMPTA